MFCQMVLEDANQLYLRLFSRAILSAAVRMNLLDPYEAQMCLCHLEADIDRAVKDGESVPLMDAVPTDPFLDLLQGAHEKLYSRMFHS